MTAGKLGVAIAILLAVARPAAQEPAGWTLSRLLEHARANEPSIRAARLEAQAVAAEVRQASLWANPRIDVEHRQVPAGMDRQTMATAEMPLELFRRGPRTAAAKATVVVASAMAEDRERMLLLDVHMAYSQYLGTSRRLAIIDGLLTQARSTLALLESRATAGAIPRLERDQASIEVTRIEASRASVAGTRERALAELRRSIGLPAGTPIAVAETLDDAIPWAEIDVALAGPPHALAITERDDVRAATAQVDVETTRREQLKSERRFDLAVYGGYMRMRSGFSQMGLAPDGSPVPIEGTFNNLVVGAMIDLPLFNRNQGSVAAADLRAASAQQLVEARKLAVAAEIESEIARLRAAATAVRAFTQRSRDLARQNVEVVREAHSLGRHTLLEVVMEQQRYLEVEMAYTEALMELLDAHAAWQAAIGRHQ